MASTREDPPRELKDETSKETLNGDEEKGIPPEEEGDVEAPAQSEANSDPEPLPPKNAGPGPPPNGGLTAWLQVLGGWMLFFNTWGILK